MDSSRISYNRSGHMPRYTEIGPNGEILYQSETIPVYLTSTYLQICEPLTPRNVPMTGQMTSDQYRTFDIPDRFENPDWWQGYSKREPDEFYRTTNQEYGRYKPLTHHMPAVYRTKPREFTEMMSIGGNYRNRGFNTSTKS